MPLKKNLIQVSFNNAHLVIKYLMAEYAVAVGLCRIFVRVADLLQA
jgi:hypothetical protein